jgi:hypothetical protein
LTNTAVLRPTTATGAEVDVVAVLLGVVPLEVVLLEVVLLDALVRLELLPQAVTPSAPAATAGTRDSRRKVRGGLPAGAVCLAHALASTADQGRGWRESCDQGDDGQIRGPSTFASMARSAYAT